MTEAAQRRQYSCIAEHIHVLEKTVDGNLNPQTETKGMQNGKKKVNKNKTVNLYLIPFLLSASSKDKKLYKLIIFI